jgi:hypothetical protein
MVQSETAEIFSGRQIQSHVDISVLRKWLQFCENNHKPLCKHTFNFEAPDGFRVIDCITRRIISWKDVSKGERYVALSYVWDTSNEEPLVQDGVIPHSTPLTIEDTILLTTELGYRYLWIDRYCIAQGDSAHKQKQIQCMDEIYGHSIVTIIAAAGDDPHHGLPGISVTKRKPQPRVRFGSKTLVYTPYTKKEVLDSKWNHRGWTYQEAILSRRKLVFTAMQVYFQCSSMHCLESIDASLEALHIHKNVRMRDNIEISRVFPLRGLGKNLEDIEKRLNEYLQRSLTTEADILNAFRGVLVAFERKFPHGIRTLCGIPIYISGVTGSSLDALAFGLLWGLPSIKMTDV